VDVFEIEQLRKSYGAVQVLQGLSMRVRAGEVYGFLGRNGAGKSTAIRIAMGITKASAGAVRLFGEPMSSRNQVQLRQRVGYVSQEQNFYPWMTARTVGDFVSGFYPTWDSATYAQLLQRLDLPPERKLGQLSGGMRVKVALALALAHHPQLLILDEPTAGLDPVARREFLELARDQAVTREMTTFFSTHLIDEVELLANQLAIVESGTTRFEGTVDALLAQFVLLVESPGVHAAPLPEALHTEGFSIVQDRALRGQRQVMVRVPSQREALALIDDQWQLQKPSLEDIFVQLVRSA
jgi:ABC-2 type transport system ATP-binding protein